MVMLHMEFGGGESLGSKPFGPVTQLYVDSRCQFTGGCGLPPVLLTSGTVRVRG